MYLICKFIVSTFLHVIKIQNKTRPEVYSWPFSKKIRKRFIEKIGFITWNQVRQLKSYIYLSDAIAITQEQCIVAKEVRKQGPLKIQF